MSNFIIRNNLGVNGYIIEATEKFGGDVSFKYGSDKIDGLKSLLSACSCEFEDIFEEEPESREFVFPSELVSLSGLREIMRYYGYGIIELNEDNIYSIVCCCVYFHIDDIKLKLYVYLKSVLNAKIGEMFLLIIKEIEEEEDLMKILNCYYMENGFDIMSNINDNYDELYYLMRIENMKVPSEKEVLDICISFYDGNQNDIDEDDWLELFSLINYGECDEDIIEKMKILTPFDICEETEYVNRQYTLNIPEIPKLEDNNKQEEKEEEKELIINEMKIERVLPNEGYINELMNKGLSDIEFQYANEENVKGNKMLLSLESDKFCEILKNEEENNGIVILPNIISRRGLIEIIKYLGNGIIELSSNNVIDILLSSSYFELKDLLIDCANYINTHFNMRMMKRLLIAASDNWDYPDEIKPVLNDYIKYNGYRLLKTKFDEFSIESFKYLLNTEMIISNESEILRYTLEYYHDYCNNHQDEELILERFKDLFNLIDFSLCDKESINYFKNVTKLEIPSNYSITIRLYYEPPDTNNELMDRLVLELEENVFDRQKNKKNSPFYTMTDEYRNQFSYQNIIDYVIHAVKAHKSGKYNINTFLIILSTIIYFKMKFPCDKWDVIQDAVNLLLEAYVEIQKNPPTTNFLIQNIPFCMTLFIDDQFIPTMEKYIDENTEEEADDKRMLYKLSLIFDLFNYKSRYDIKYRTEFRFWLEKHFFSIPEKSTIKVQDEDEKPRIKGTLNTPFNRNPKYHFDQTNCGSDLEFADDYTMKKVNRHFYSYCYLNFSLDNNSGVCSIRYRQNLGSRNISKTDEFEKDYNHGWIILGFFTTPKYEGPFKLFLSNKMSCIWFSNIFHQWVVHDMKEGNLPLPSIKQSNHDHPLCTGDKKEYTMIYDMNKHEMKFQYENTESIVICENIPEKIYPMIELFHREDWIEIIEVKFE